VLRGIIGQEKHWEKKSEKKGKNNESLTNTLQSEKKGEVKRQEVYRSDPPKGGRRLTLRAQKKS